jgi:hypothetical protein
MCSVEPSMPPILCSGPVGAPRRYALALGASLALVACGESGPTDEEQVRDVLAAFGRAAAARDYRALCDRLLAPALAQRVQRIGLPCEVALEEGLGAVEDPRLAVGPVTIEGDRARAEVRSSARGEAPSRDVVELARSAADGRWRLASLAGPGS